MGIGCRLPVPDTRPKNLYSAIIRNAEALGGKNVLHDAVKKVSFQSLFKVAKVSELTTLSGSELQTVGAATEKARLAKTVRVRGTASLGAWLNCRVVILRDVYHWKSLINTDLLFFAVFLSVGMHTFIYNGKASHCIISHSLSVEIRYYFTFDQSMHGRRNRINF